MLRLVSWNVNGLRANLKKGFWDNSLALKPDILGIQETKSDGEIMLSGIAQHPEFDLKFHSATIKKGYSGVATFSRLSQEFKIPGQPILLDADGQNAQASGLVLENYQVGLGIEEFDQEGRMIIAKYSYQGQKFTLLNGYYPQGGRGPHRIEYKIRFYRAVFELCQSLRAQGERLILCGDLNTTVCDIDLARPKENRNTTGCLPEEREALNWFLDNGFVDSFRHFYPDKTDMYTYWDQITRARERNVGWRIDYFLVDEALMPFVKDAHIWMEIMGSDHCPVGIDLEF